MKKETYLPYAAWITICLVWGTTYLAIRVAVRTLPDAWMSSTRFMLAGVLMLLYFRIRGEKFPGLKDLGHIAFMGIALIGIGNWLVVWAENVIPSGLAALMIALTPFWIAGVESVSRQGERWNLGKLIGLVMGFSGVILLLLANWESGWDPAFLYGIGALLIAEIFWAIGSVYSKYKKIEAKPLVSAALQMVFGGLFLLIVATVKGDFRPIHWEISGLIAFAYLVIFGALIGYACYIYSLAKLPSSLVSLYAYINPVIAVWLGWLLLKESVSWLTLVATAVILSGVWLVTRKPGPGYDRGKALGEEIVQFAPEKKG
jgi:drug/metabolite transporter (DMT)-like permease